MVLTPDSLTIILAGSFAGKDAENGDTEVGIAYIETAGNLKYVFATTTIDVNKRITNLDIEPVTSHLWGCGDFNSVDLLIFKLPQLTTMAPSASSMVTG